MPSCVPSLTTLGVTSTLCVATIVLGAVTLHRHYEYQDIFRDMENCDTYWPEQQSSGRRVATATVVFFGHTMASAIATLVLGLFTRSNRDDSQRLRVALGGLYGGPMMSVGASY